MRTYIIFAIGTLLVTVAPLAAQRADRPKRIDLPQHPPQESRYVPFPFSADPEALVRDQLDTLKKLEPFKEFVEKILRDPSKFKVDSRLIKQLNLEDPKVQEKLKQWVEKDAQGNLPVTPEERKQLQEAVQQIVKTQPPPQAPPPESPPADAGAAPGLPPADADADARDWLKDFMQQAGESRFGDWLRDSPAWQDVFADLARNSRLPLRAPDTAGFERLTRGLFKLDRLPTIDAQLLERLGNLKPPELPRWTRLLPSVSRPSLPTVAPPPLPNAANLEKLALWLLSLGLVAVSAWQASRWLRWSSASRQAAAEIGPWPVAPELVTTRAELIRAFDYLAVRLLGRSARTWHHRAIAQQLAQRDADHSAAAASLAALYERARYAPGAGELTGAESARARGALAQLAGNAAT